jgi:hypothetical protein
LRSRPAIRPPPQPHEAKCAARSSAIALALIGPDAAAAERNRQVTPRDRQPAARRIAGPCFHAQKSDGASCHYDTVLPGKWDALKSRCAVIDLGAMVAKTPS